MDNFRSWDTDRPSFQSYWVFSKSQNAWAPQTAALPPSSTSPGSSGGGFARLSLYSWNIDFMLPLEDERMAAALQTLQNITSETPRDIAIVIFLQECVQSDLRLIGSLPWVRDNFYITDVDIFNWADYRYGTTTLVDRRLSIASCFRVHYSKTEMGRDGLFVDVLMGADSTKRIRLCNTHLESLTYMPPCRPPQMRVIAEQLRANGVHGAAVAGDFNAIQDFDRTLHTVNGLKDAYLELGGKEDSEDGHTWGQQVRTAARQRFGTSRLDKIFYCGGMYPREFRKFGAGVQLTGEQGDELMSLGYDKPWITDHLGVMAILQVD